MSEFHEPEDFLAESQSLYSLLEELESADFDRATAFKQWTFNNVLTHLHVWNRMATRALAQPEEFREFSKHYLAERERIGIRAFEDASVAPLRGPALLAAWRQGFEETAGIFCAANPSARVPWIGPDMSARSAIAARLMETWAHGQAIYDLMGIERHDTDRIHSIATLGVKTFGWSFVVRDEAVPAAVPYVRLMAPSGAVWQWGVADSAERVEGQAGEFCQVVTQTRNLADTSLRVSGQTAQRWMARAQCFAGLPRDPPPAGSRRKLACRWGV